MSCRYLVVGALSFAVCWAYAENTRTFSNKKLWRDDALGFMQKEGCYVVWRSVDDSEFDTLMRGKLLEEAHEVVDAKSREELVLELADLQETIKAVAEWHDISPEEIQTAQTKKFEDRGGYTRKIFVEYVECPVGSYGEQYYLADPLKYPEITQAQ